LQSRVEEADPGIMVKLTMIARVTDGLPLAEGLDDGRDQKDLEFYKQQAKQLCKRLSQQKQGASRMSVETGPYFFQYPLSLSLSVHVLEACIWVSLHSLLVHKSLSGEFVYEVELLAVEVSSNSLHVGKSFSQKFVCEVELAFEVLLHWPMC
jgi:hypothetical protein